MTPESPERTLVLDAIASASKILWLRRWHADRLARARRYLLMPDYFAYRLTGEAVTDPNTASSTGFTAGGDAGYDAKALAAAGVAESSLARILPSGTPIGRVLPDMAEEWGLAEGALLVTGTNDQYAGALGAGNCRPGILSETTGTCLALVTLAERLPSPMPPGLLGGQYPIPGYQFALAYAKTAGLVLDWFRRQFRPEQSLADLEALAAESPPGSRGLIVLPHFDGMVSPQPNSNARGAVLNLALSHTLADVYRAMLESIAFSLRENIELLQSFRLRARSDSFHRRRGREQPVAANQSRRDRHAGGKAGGHGGGHARRGHAGGSRLRRVRVADREQRGAVPCRAHLRAGCRAARPLRAAVPELPRVVRPFVRSELNMSKNHTWPVNPDDVEILRALYRRQREIAQDPVMAERRQLWLDHHSLASRRPMILAETSGVLDECVPVSALRCREEWARGLERGLRDLVFRYERVRDDFVVEPWINAGWRVTVGDFGVQVAHVKADNQGRLGSYHWDPPIKDLDRDFDQLHFRSLSVDRAGDGGLAGVDAGAVRRHPARAQPRLVLVDHRADLDGHRPDRHGRLDDGDGRPPRRLAPPDGLPARRLPQLPRLVRAREPAAAQQRERLRRLRQRGLHPRTASTGPAAGDGRAGEGPVGSVGVAGDGRRVAGHVRGVRLPVPGADHQPVRPGLLRLLRADPQPHPHHQAVAEPAGRVGVAVVQPGAHGR